MSYFIEWSVDTAGDGSSVPATEISPDKMTGFVEGVRVISKAGVSSSLTGILSEVEGLEDTIWAGTIGSDQTIRKYPVYDEVDNTDEDTGTKGKFYVSNQHLKMALANAGGAVAEAVTVRVKFIPDDRG